MEHTNYGASYYVMCYMITGINVVLQCNGINKQATFTFLWSRILGYYHD